MKHNKMNNKKKKIVYNICYYNYTNNIMRVRAMVKKGRPNVTRRDKFVRLL